MVELYNNLLHWSTNPEHTGVVEYVGPLVAWLWVLALGLAAWALAAIFTQCTGRYYRYLRTHVLWGILFGGPVFLVANYILLMLFGLFHHATGVSYPLDMITANWFLLVALLIPWHLFQATCFPRGD